MAQQVVPRLRRRCLIGSLTAPSWKSAKNGTTIRLAGKDPRLSCSVDCKKPTPPTGWCAGRARRRPARTREEQAPVPREHPERCRAVQTIAEEQDAHGGPKSTKRYQWSPTRHRSKRPSRSRTPSLLGIFPPLLTLAVSGIARARVLDAAEFRSYGHYTWESMEWRRQSRIFVGRPRVTEFRLSARSCSRRC